MWDKKNESEGEREIVRKRISKREEYGEWKKVKKGERKRERETFCVCICVRKEREGERETYCVYVGVKREREGERERKRVLVCDKERKIEIECVCM